MKTHYALLTLILAAPLLAGEGGHPDTTGWQPLFADDLSNAIKPKGDVWTVADGELTASKDQCLWTEKEYENFALDLEFKVAPGGNSGVIVYSPDIKAWVPSAVEVQILDDDHPKWKKVDPNWKCGGIFGHIAPKKAMAKPAGEWNRFTITCRGQKIHVVLNGEEVVDIDMKDYTSNKTNPDGSPVPKWLSNPLSTLETRGRIGFQGKHGGVSIWFRNIRIKEFE